MDVCKYEHSVSEQLILIRLLFVRQKNKQMIFKVSKNQRVTEHIKSSDYFTGCHIKLQLQKCLAAYTQ